ncbi:MAG: DUF5683 domain-containing protein [Leadbetterella sp.]
MAIIRQLSFLGFLFVTSLSLFGQGKLDTTKIKSKVVTKPIVAPDTARGKKLRAFKKNSADVLPKVFGFKKYSPKEKPKIAFIRSMILPGWGQITNKQWYMLPIIYTGAGVGGYFIYENNRKCNEYVSYLRIMDKLKINEVLVPDSDGIYKGPFSKDLINNTAKTYRRWKQGTVIGVGVGWLLFAVDANVSAHLKGFDVSDDISMKFSPTLIPSGSAVAFGIKMNFNLNK